MQDTNLPEDFEAIREAHEELLWVERPNWLDFIITSSGIFLLVAIAWGLLDWFIISALLEQGKPVAIGFIFLHASPVWLAALNIIRLILVHGNTYYGFSNRRVLWHSGFLGTDFHTLDFDQIKRADVSVNPLQKLLGLGTVRFNTIKFVGIKKPYAVLKKYKQISIDVKTDWQFPNKFRPDENPGYRTTYQPPHSEQ